MPKQPEIEIPLLEVISSLGGNGQPKEIYPLVTNKFPQLSQIDLIETIVSGGNKWTNRIQWVRHKLVKNGDLESPERGVWKITKKGVERLKGKGQDPKGPQGCGQEGRRCLLGSGSRQGRGSHCLAYCPGAGKRGTKDVPGPF